MEFSGNGALSAGGGEGRGFGGDVRACISTSAGVSPCRCKNRFVVSVVALNKLRFAFEVRVHGAEFDLHDSPERFVFDFLELGAWQAGRNSLDVAEHCPRLVDGAIYGELVGDCFSHSSKSLVVSMSKGDPEQGIRSTRCSYLRSKALAPKSPVLGNCGHSDASILTG